MKHTAPQIDLSFPAEPFALVSQSAQDGARLAAEVHQANLDRLAAEKAQLALIDPMPHPHSTSKNAP